MNSFTALGVLVLVAGLASGAKADTISAVGGLAFGRDSGMNSLSGPNPMYGMEYSFDLSKALQLGGFYDYTGLTQPDGHSGSVQFMGMLLRFEPGSQKVISPFFDAKAGMGRQTEDELDSGMKLSYGGDLGLRVPITRRTSLSPRFDLELVPNSPSAGAALSPLMAFSLMFSFRM